MKDKRRAAALFEKNKNTDSEPNKTDKSQENYRSRPTRQCINIFQIGVVKIIGEMNMKVFGKDKLYFRRHLPIRDKFAHRSAMSVQVLQTFRH